MPAVATGTDIEGFGIVYLEAALAALPSIAGAHGGCSEAVLHEQTGLIVNGDDDDALTRAIRALATDGDKRRRMGLAARDRARQDFDWPGLIHSLAGEVASVLGGRRPADGAP
jgi:phosphatidylinositol alpha-1,6-mannosyltransferase